MPDPDQQRHCAVLIPSGSTGGRLLTPKHGSLGTSHLSPLQLNTPTLQITLRFHHRARV